MRTYGSVGGPDGQPSALPGKRPPIAYARASLRLSAAPEAWRSASSFCEGHLPISAYCSPALRGLCSVHTRGQSVRQVSYGTSSSHYHIPHDGSCAAGNGAPSNPRLRRQARLGGSRANGGHTSRPRGLSSACGVGRTAHDLSPACFCRCRPTACRSRDRLSDQQNCQRLEGRSMKVIYDRETDTLIA